ncbi:MAG: CBS domain-containing protein [Phycisphaerae bacterium]|nr:CBS domain-containing protein [Phycisphaerae bacterium]
MLIEQLMTKHVISVSMDATLGTIRDLFQQCRFHHVVVLEECRIVGIISDRDLLRTVSPFAGTVAERSMDAASLRKHAHQIMNRSVITVRPDMHVADAAIILQNNRISCLPVVDQHGACVGIVTLRDFLSWSLEQVADTSCVVKLAGNSKRAA